jgi:S-DNA-T family DNA segregation ATPase FtsK/SpoIIIE
MQIELTLRDHDGASRDVSIRAPMGTTLAELGHELGDSPSAQYWSARRQILPSELLGGAGLRTGDVVCAAPSTDQPILGYGLLRLRVVSGPDAGRDLPLARGAITIGRSPACDLVLHDPRVSRRHALLDIAGNGASVADAGSTHGTTLDGYPVGAVGSPFAPGALLQVGDTYLALHLTAETPASVRSQPGGARLINRSPRPSALADRTITFPSRPARLVPHRVQWLAALLPAAVGGLLALLLHSPQFLLFTLLSPLIILGTALSDRLYARRTHTRDTGSFTKNVRAAQAELAAALAAETITRREHSPDPCRLREIARTPGTRIWERRRSDPDLLLVRVGLGAAPSRTVVLRGSQCSPGAVLGAVPVDIDLKDGPIGVVAAAAMRVGVGRWLLAQLAVLCSPADVEVTLLLSDSVADQWRWARWLPHVASRVARTEGERDLVLEELRALAEDRAGDGRSRGAWRGPWQVLIIDRAGALADQSALATVLSLGPRVGITAIALDSTHSRLPSACATVLHACGETGSRLNVRGPDGTGLVVVADQVSVDWAESVARSLASLEEAGADRTPDLPDHCRLLELLDLDTVGPAEITQRWAVADWQASTVLGAGPGGPTKLDLVSDGPHALIAGTTGSGKSELLQTLIAGFAAQYPPDRLTFILIDYKGGAAFADCAELPHTVGVVTDLDPALTRRALSSLHSELRRREQLLATCGAKDLEAYRASAPSEPLARLVLVVDEFATLAEELPDFVSGLVGIAQRGRSLGIHLILATQRPAGVVSPEIRANMTLRIALRVADSAESSDVIGTDAASRISRHVPGRAYLRIGTQSVVTQTARVAGPKPAGATDRVVVRSLDDWRRPVLAGEPEPDERTDLEHLVDTVRAAAVHCGLSTPRRPWLPVLPARLPLITSTDRPEFATVCLGQADRPDQQAQPPLELDLAQGSSLLFAGAPRTGRTSALVTLAIASALRLSPQELDLHVIDAGGGALASSLDQLPHLGTLAGPGETAVTDLLLARLESAVADRHREVVALGYTSTAQARLAGHKLPISVLLVDGWEAFVAASEEYDGGRSVARFMELLRSAPAAGLSVALAGGRGALATRPASAVSRKYVLRLAERGDYALAGLTPRSVPEHMPPGRAVEAGTGTEVQLAYIGSAERRRLIDQLRTRWPLPRDRRAITVRALPTRVMLADLEAEDDGFVLGVGGDGATPVTIDVFAGAGRLLVAGPTRSGRSTVLSCLRDQALRQGITVLVAAPPHSPLTRSPGPTNVITPTDRRGAAAIPAGAQFPAASNGPRSRTLLLIDDSEAFTDTAVGSGLESLVQAQPAGLAVVAAGRAEELAVTYRGVGSLVRRSRCGLLLQPSAGDGELVGVRLPHTRAALPPGRGVLVGEPAWGLACADGPVPLQVAVP